MNVRSGPEQKTYMRVRPSDSQTASPMPMLNAMVEFNVHNLQPYKVMMLWTKRERKNAHTRLVKNDESRQLNTSHDEGNKDLKKKGKTTTTVSQAVAIVMSPLF